MSKNIFFEQKGPFLLSQLLENVKIKNKIKFFDVKTLTDASIRDLTFFESSAYIEAAKNTKALSVIKGFTSELSKSSNFENLKF